MSKKGLSARPNILVVDDLNVNIQLIKSILVKVDANLIIANSGKEALQKIKGQSITLALLDIFMPEMNGGDLAVRIQKCSTEKIPIIFITAFSGDEMYREKYYKMGAVDFIQKPFSKNILLGKVGVFLELNRQKQEIKEQKRKIENHVNKLKEFNQTLKKRLSYENILSKISGMAISVNDIGIFLTAVLSVIGETLNLSRTYIFSYKPETNTINNIYNWSQKGVPTFSDYFQDMSCNPIQDWINSFKKNKIHSYSDIEKIRNENVRNILREQKVFSILAIPLFVKNNFWGFLTFSDCFKHREWSKQDVEFLLSISRIIVTVTERKLVDEELKNTVEQLHQLTKYIEKVREEERVAISRELHDDLGQALTAVKIDLGIIRQGVTDSEVNRKIVKVSALVGETIKTVQKITFQLRPKIIDDLGLVAGIDWYTNEFSKRNGIEINLDLDSDIEIQADVAMVVFRIMQESLTNISRHANATKIGIQLKKEDDQVIFTVTDNGKGIAVNQLKSKTSFGIIGMKERAESIGGNLEIYNQGKGTIAKLVFLLKEIK